ncbi:MAG: CBS domain-containing protein [Rhodospirillales bacterium]|jgi:CBS domain-containing protein|nr:CBS domain-containing protein [Rhodospirillales bacterium]MDP6883149.1 CBS domain-containing protein [Rhodospirillales bacterium]
MSDSTYVKVSDVMTSSMHVISRTATVAEAIQNMRRLGVSSLIVERRDDADEFGVITINDIAREVIAPDQAPDRVNVYEVMSKPVLTVPADMNIKYAARMLVEFGPSRAIVVGSDRSPVGIVTLRDMVLRQTPEEDETA